MRERSAPMRKIEGLLLVRLATVAVLSLAADSATAWVYPEHRDLALQAVQGLDAEHNAQFELLWQEARGGSEGRLCAQGGDAAQGLVPSCIDWAALSAIAGDHSCSSRQMLETASTSDWILVVADVAAQLKADLASVPMTAPTQSTAGFGDIVSDTRRRLASQAAEAQRLNALRTADLRLQRADSGYATRAGSNNAHFLLARPRTDISLSEYAALTMRSGSEISAIGVYAHFHLSALQKASRLAHEELPSDERAALARAMLSDEAFALHFLEDAYAAGHIAGTWGDTSQRKGTHDFYNQNGLEVFTWAGGSRSIVLMGDANMRPEDAAIASKTVRLSLQQVLDVAAGRSGGPQLPYFPKAPAEPDSFNVCQNSTLQERAEGMRAQLPDVLPFFAATLAQTPIPSLGSGLGSMPRSRSELGAFIGFRGSIDWRTMDRGFVPDTGSGHIAGLDLSLRAGFGLDGVMGPSGDGLVYGSIGFRSDAASSNRVSGASGPSSGGNLSAAIPARWGPTIRLRMPFYVVPGDLLFMSPLYFFNPKAYTDMAVSAGNGGLIPWQVGLPTAVGRFQFILGREFGITFYGLSGEDDLIAPSTELGGTPRIVRFKSTLFDLPILNYQPSRSYSGNQAASWVFQLFVDADVPRGGSVDYPPGAPVPKLETVWSVGLRLHFDWRHYY